MLTLIFVLLVCSICLVGACLFSFDGAVRFVAPDFEQVEHDLVVREWEDWEREQDRERQEWVSRQRFARAAYEANNKKMVALFLRQPKIQQGIQAAKAMVNRQRAHGREV